MASAAFTFALFEFVLLIFSLSFHECAHAWMASRLGDQTARLQGRVTLNPMYHVDPIGTLLFPALAIFGPFFGLSWFSGMLVGWARPTPILSRNFKQIRRDENLVTLAGPVSNLILVLVSLLLLLVIVHAVPNGREIVYFTFRHALLPGLNPTLQALLLLAAASIEINLSLFFFNLFPIPPLDGSRLLANSLSYTAAQAYYRIPFWVSWILMVAIGGTVLRLLLFPALGVVLFVLGHA